MIIRLSGGRQIPVDAKVPFAAWLEALDCTDDRRRGALMAAHARALRGHVDALSAKAYWRHFQPAPEFVVLFVPGEPLLDAALAMDPGLSDHAFGRNVVIATPTSLIALLRTIAFTWRQERLSASAAEVHALGRELHGRLGTLAGHLEQRGSRAGTCRAVVQPDGAVHGEPGAGDGPAVHRPRRHRRGTAGPEPVDTVPRRPQAAEFDDDPADAAQVMPLRSAARRAWDATVDG